MTRRLRSEDGFTLTELLIVLVVLGILVTVGLVSYLGFRNRGEDAGAAADIRTVIPAISSYYADNDTFVGMTPAALQSYDGSIDASRYSIPAADLSSASYCIETATTPVWRKNGPSGSIENASCP